MICSCVVDYTRLNICVQHSVKPWGDVKALYTCLQLINEHYLDLSVACISWTD